MSYIAEGSEAFKTLYIQSAMLPRRTRRRRKDEIRAFHKKHLFHLKMSQSSLSNYTNINHQNNTLYRLEHVELFCK